MASQQEIEQRLNDLTNTVNSIISGAKKLPDLEVASSSDNNSFYVRDSSDGKSKQLPSAEVTSNIVTKYYDSAASSLTFMVAELNTLNPPLEITANEIYRFKLSTGEVYELKDKGKGIYGLNNLQVVEDDFVKISGAFKTYANGGISRTDVNDTNIGANAVNLTTDSGAASGEKSHAEGEGTIASGDFSRAEGLFTIASGEVSHAEGQATEASGANSHSEGLNTISSGNNSHAEGNITTASGEASHAEGGTTIASGTESHAEGKGNFARSEGEHSGGVYGTDYTPTNTDTDRLVNYGNGTSPSNRSDAFTIFKNGAVRFFRATLASILNPLSGMLIFDSGNNNRPTIHDGTSWKPLRYAGEERFGDEIINSLKADFPSLNMKYIRKTLRTLWDEEFLQSPNLKGVFLPEINDGTSLKNIFNSNQKFNLTRNTVKYRHRESLLIEEVGVSQVAVDYLNGFPELIVEPQRTNTVKNSEPTAQENSDDTNVTYLSLDNPFGFASFAKVTPPTSGASKRWAGLSQEAKFGKLTFYGNLNGRGEFQLNPYADRETYEFVPAIGSVLITDLRDYIISQKKIKNNYAIVESQRIPATPLTQNGIWMVPTTASFYPVTTSGWMVEVFDVSSKFLGSYIRTTGTTKTVDADVYTITNLVSDGLISATEGTIIERGSNQEVRTVWTGGNRLKFIDNVLVSTTAEVPNNNAFTLDTSSYRLSEVLIFDIAILPN